MTPKNLLEKIESEQPVETITLRDGTPVWPLIRQAVYFTSMRAKVQYNNKLRTRSKVQLIKNFFYGIKYLLQLSRFDYVFFNNADKRVNYNNRMFDIYYDAWADAFDSEKCLFVEWAIEKHHPKKRVHSKHVVSDLPMKFFAAIYSVFVKVEIKNEALLSKILNEQSIQLDVKRELKAKLGLFKAYKKLFKKIDAQAVFVLSSFTKTGEVLAAKELGIPVYEAQHGFIGHTHPFYHATKKFPTFYPDFLISFGASEKKEALETLVFEPNKIIPVGSLQLDLVKKRKVPEQLAALKNAYEKVFCVTLQAIQDELILNWVTNQAVSHPEWLFILRPKQPNTNFELYTKTNNVTLMPEISTYDVLKACDYNITIFSTTVVEGIFLGAKPILFNIDALPYKYFDLNNSDIAIINDNESLTEKHLSKSGTFNTPYFVEDYFNNVAKAAPCI
ncbi:MAG: hypothetical protein R3359_00665 [Marinirhabdus sp.]|nr:hypothetical protein [Marinirhabdus sp.]